MNLMRMPNACLKGSVNPKFKIIRVIMVIVMIVISNMGEL